MTRSVAARFSAAAGTYERGAGVQRIVADRLAEVLATAPVPAPVTRVLEIGCGTGLLTGLLRRRYAAALICAVDAAEPMVRETCRRHGGRLVAGVVADGSAFASRKRFPLVASSSALHWITPLDRAMRRVAGLLTRDGVLACALMLDGTLGELHAVRRAVAPLKLPRARLPDETDLRRALRDAGLETLALSATSIAAIYPSAREFLRTLHRQGVTGGAFSAADRLLTRGELARVAAEYQRCHGRADGRVTATYRVGYVIARGRRAGPPPPRGSGGPEGRR
jgi:malonyl-CoA O-methyltransferase